MGFVTTGLAIGAIAVATLRPAWSEVDTLWQRCFVCGGRPVSDALTNVLLFVPLGVGLALAGVRGRRLGLVGASVSCLVELIQLVLPGRDPSVGDVVFNTLGTGVGAAAVWRFPMWLRAATAKSGLVAATGLCLVVLATGWLLGPSLPATEYWGQWTPYRDHFEWYRGRVLGAEVGSQAVRSSRMPDSPAARAALRDGQPITIEAVAGPPVSRLAPLFSIADAVNREIALVGVDGEDLMFRRRTRAARYGLDQPDIRFHDGLAPVRAGDPLRVRVWRETPAEWCMTVNDRTACGLGISGARGWALVYHPDAFPDWLRDLLDAVWLAALAFPLGLALRPRPVGAAALGLMVVALVPGSHGVGLLAPDLLDWAGVGLGLAAGLVIARVRRRPALGH